MWTMELLYVTLPSGHKKQQKTALYWLYQQLTVIPHSSCDDKDIAGLWILDLKLNFDNAECPREF
jgi:hypothetical protein